MSPVTMITGYIIGNPVCRESATGVPYCNCSIRTQRTIKAADGTYHKVADIFDVIAFWDKAKKLGAKSDNDFVNLGCEIIIEPVELRDGSIVAFPQFIVTQI